MYMHNCKHIANAPRANATTKALSKSLQASPREEFQYLSPTLKKKIKQANTQATETVKKMKPMTSLIWKCNLTQT